MINLSIFDFSVRHRDEFTRQKSSPRPGELNSRSGTVDGAGGRVGRRSRLKSTEDNRFSRRPPEETVFGVAGPGRRPDAGRTRRAARVRVGAGHGLGPVRGRGDHRDRRGRRSAAARPRARRRHGSHVPGGIPAGSGRPRADRRVSLRSGLSDASTRLGQTILAVGMEGGGKCEFVEGRDT